MQTSQIVAAALQYSKRLSRFICWIWAVYRFGILAVAVIEPDSAAALATTLAYLDWIMMANEATYLINSLGEKYIYSDKYILRWLDKGGFNTILSRINLAASKANNIFDGSLDSSIEEQTTEEEINNG